MNKLVIYRITNTKTGMSYIGQTRQGFAARKTQHLSRLTAGVRDHSLYEAMRRDGVDAFEFEVLCHVLHADYLGQLERLLIAEYDTFRSGYNMTDGGDGVSDETCAKISECMTGRDVTPWIAKVWEGRRRNGTDKMDMSQFVPAGAKSRLAKSYLIQTPTGRLLAITGLKAFCRENGLTFKSMYDTMNGVQSHHKGFKLLSPLGVGHSQVNDKYSSNASLMGAQ